jgi:hypothetical protein
MKMKKKLTTLVSCVVILGFTAAVEVEGKGNEYESRRDGYRYHSSSQNRYYPESQQYRHRYHGKYERKILRKIMKNKRRILKLERKIHRISRRAHYKGYHRHSDMRRIRRMEREIRFLKHRNRQLRRLLNRRYRYRY